MRKKFTQAEIKEYLEANPYGFNFHVGDLADLENKDYIFFDYLEERPISADNTSQYVTSVEISIVSKDYDNTRLVAKYVQGLFNIAFSYSNYEEHEYYLAQGDTEIFIYAGE